MVLLITSNNAEAPAARVTSAEDDLMTAMQVAVTENRKKTSEHHQQIHFFPSVLSPRNQKLYFRMLRNYATKRNQEHLRRNTKKQMHVGRRYIEMEELAQ